MTLRTVLLLVAGGCSGDDVAGDAAQVSTYVEVQLHQAFDENGEWSTDADGHSGELPWNRVGPRPSPGTCLTVSSTTDIGEVTLTAVDPRLVIDGLGTFRMRQYPGGELQVEGGTDAFPRTPFLAAGTATSFMLDDTRVISTDSPAWPELLEPPTTTEIALRQNMHFSWTPAGEDHVSLLIIMTTASFAFRGFVKCHLPDSGTADVPAIEAPSPDVTNVLVQLRTEHYVGKQFGGVMLEFFVRQLHSRRYAASVN